MAVVSRNYVNTQCNYSRSLVLVPHYCECGPQFETIPVPWYWHLTAVNVDRKLKIVMTAGRARQQNS